MGYDDALAALQGAGRLPSVAAAVARAGVPVWSGCVSVDDGVTSGSSYRIGSITKTMTAVLVLQLRDEGLLALDDPIGSVVPETGYADATIRALLSHTSGMQSEPVGPWWERSTGGDADSLIAANDGSGRVAAAGEYFHYSNLGFGLLGEAIARLRGTDWWTAVQTRLLAPLGMAETSYHAPTDHAPGRSVDHFAHTLTPEPHTDTGAMAPAGQAWSTVADLLRWADFLAVGHADVVPPSTLAEMAGAVPPAAAYGLGLRVLRVGNRVLVGHTGSMPGFQASLFVDRESRDAVVALTNATTGLRPEQVPAILLDGAPCPNPGGRWEPTTQVPEPVAPMLGIWFWGNTAFGVEWAHDTLLVRDLRTADVSDRFAVIEGELIGIDGYHEGERLEVRRRTDGTVDHLECATFIYTRVPYDPNVTIPGGHPAS
ncbi:serine hydrolase domain-containing protein [Nocardioides sp. WS12]|uniref:serine hydrolase domain-containing protein n=1 Tax=Nocardioides sp. WS12 TaxID=2486272 RepID=UPI0015FD03A9|nr:serine hydrolase domain-containing protein [Nocardioides sp. WS12]